MSLCFSSPSFDRETRMLEVGVGELVVSCAYVPNGQKSDTAYRDKLGFLQSMVAHVRGYRAAQRPLVLVGDLNVTREERDVHPRLRKDGQVGQRAEERRLFDRLMAEGGLVDAGRAAAPGDDGLFTWWPPWRDEKAKNRGWRLDYCLVSDELSASVVECTVERDVGSSDHAPVVLELAAPDAAQAIDRGIPFDPPPPGALP